MMLNNKTVNLYTLFFFHPREDYFFSVVDKNNKIFEKFQFPECRDSSLRNSVILVKEEFIDRYQLDLETFLRQYDLYTCYTGGVGELFSERAVVALKEELMGEIEFIPCTIKGRPIPMYAALFLKSAPLVKDFNGMDLIFEVAKYVDAQYGIQDENKGLKFVTQAFVDLVEKYQLNIEFRLQTP